MQIPHHAPADPLHDAGQTQVGGMDVWGSGAGGGGMALTKDQGEDARGVCCGAVVTGLQVNWKIENIFLVMKSTSTLYFYKVFKLFIRCCEQRLTKNHLRRLDD